MDARGIIDYYGMLRLLKALEGHGFTEKELKRVAAQLEAELEAPPFRIETSGVKCPILAGFEAKSLLGFPLSLA